MRPTCRWGFGRNTLACYVLFELLEMSRCDHSSPAKLRACAGFTILEMAFAAAIVCIFVVGAVLALTQMNRYASASRLRSAALALAQQRIDEVLTSPWLVNGTRAAVLAPGTKTESNLQLNRDAQNAQSGLSSAFTQLSDGVRAMRSTTILNLTTRRLRAEVSVSYTYRNRAYQVNLTTLRVTDNI